MDRDSTRRLLSFALPFLSLVSFEYAAAQPRAGAPVSIEAESLIESAKASDGKVVAQNMQPFGPEWSGNAQLFWVGAGQGSELRLRVPIAAAGRYQIFVHFTKAPDYALVRASFDGAPSITYNGYAPGVTHDRALVGMRDVTGGVHDVLLKIEAKEGQSRGYNVGIDRIVLEPVSTTVPPASSATRAGGAGRLSPPTAAVGASMVEGKTPVLHISAGAAPRERIVAAGIEPLPMAGQVSLTQQATSLPVTPSGEPIRLTAAAPHIPKRAYLSLVHGIWVTDDYNGWLRLPADAKLILEYLQLEVKRPHLLDCGVHLEQPTQIRISVNTGGALGEKLGPDLVTAALPQDNHYQHLTAVLVPEFPSSSLVVQSTGATVLVLFCDLTPFK